MVYFLVFQTIAASRWRHYFEIFELVSIQSVVACPESHQCYSFWTVEKAMIVLHCPGPVDCLDEGFLLREANAVVGLYLFSS